jgi:AhpD family alkylhydroperoxidase
MSQLTARERELVSLGAAMGSNCVSCIEYHIPASRNAGLTEAQISEAIQLADKTRQVPARKTLDTALDLLSLQSLGAAGDKTTAAAQANKPCCGSPPASRYSGTAQSASTRSPQDRGLHQG